MTSPVRKGARQLMPSLSSRGRWMGENQLSPVVLRGLYERARPLWPRSLMPAPEIQRTPVPAVTHDVRVPWVATGVESLSMGPLKMADTSSRYSRASPCLVSRNDSSIRASSPGPGR